MWGVLSRSDCEYQFNCYCFVGWIAIVQASSEETSGFNMLSKLQRSGAAAKVDGLVNGIRRTVVTRYVDVDHLFNDMRKLWSLEN